MQKSWGATKHTESLDNYVKALLKKNRHQDNPPATTAIGHRHTIVLNIVRGKMKFCKKRQTFEVIG